MPGCSGDLLELGVVCVQSSCKSLVNVGTSGKQEQAATAQHQHEKNKNKIKMLTYLYSVKVETKRTKT